MDSGNSGSLQSSSGGDEEYDSRAADSVSAFMTGGPISNPPPPFFDPLSNYLQLHQNPNSSSLFNSTWPRASLRSDPNPVTHDVIGSMLPSSSPFMPSFQPPPQPVGADNATAAPPLQNQARNPKKRSRASRRAPTTVLTTDTTNFRAMVQEFTGIPAPPFSNSSFPRSRVDLFATRSDAAAPPPYLRRPFPHKIQPPHSLLSSAALDAVIAASSTTTTATAAAASSSNPSMNYQLPITQNSNIFNLPNPLLTSLLQSNPKFPFSTSQLIPSNINKMGGFDEQFNPNHGNNLSETLHAFPNLITSSQIGLQPDHHGNRVGGEDKDEDGVNLRPSNGGYSFARNAVNNSSKMGFSSTTSTTNFHGGKAPETVASRGEGMLESWICSSD